MATEVDAIVWRNHGHPLAQHPAADARVGPLAILAHEHPLAQHPAAYARAGPRVPRCALATLAHASRSQPVASSVVIEGQSTRQLRYSSLPAEIKERNF